MRAGIYSNLIELNKMHIEVEDGRCEAEARDRMISTMNEANNKLVEEEALKMQQLHTQYE